MSLKLICSKKFQRFIGLSRAIFSVAEAATLEDEIREDESNARAILNKISVA